MSGGFPHSEISGSKSVCRLPEAFRRLSRLSSPLTAKASTVCASSLDHITPSNLVTVYNVKTTFAENLHREHANFTLTRHAASESNTSVYFYHIPKFLKNSSGAKSRTQHPSHQDQMFSSELSAIRVNGGAKEDRTPDLLRAKQALSQLSYGPFDWWVWADSNCRPHPYQGCALTN